LFRAGVGIAAILLRVNVWDGQGLAVVWVAAVKGRKILE
jgi:hypothetical protein